MTVPTEQAARYRRAAALAVEAEALMEQLDQLVPGAQRHIAASPGGAVASPAVPDDDVIRREALDALEDAKACRERARALSTKITQLRAEIVALLEL